MSAFGSINGRTTNLSEACLKLSYFAIPFGAASGMDLERDVLRSL